jgi:hypothetical protein
MIGLNVVAALLFLFAPEIATNIHDVHSLSVYRGLVHKGLVHENVGSSETDRLQRRQQEDAFVEELRKIGGVKYYYRILCWGSAALLLANTIVVWRRR